jgi:predicted nucleic acid-binding protein
VLTEAWHLLGYAGNSRQALAEMCNRGILSISFDLKSDLKSVLKLLQKYADTPMDFADACLVQMVENLESAKVWTVDSDFQIYRRSNRRVIPTLSPLG